MLQSELDMYEQYRLLVAAVLREALDWYGPMYIAIPDGQFWCEVLNLEPSVVFRYARVRTQ